MYNLLRKLTIFLLLSITILSPWFAYKFFVRARNIAYANEYVKKKVKVDSLVVVAESYGYSGHSNDVYKIYNLEHDLEFAFTDHKGSLITERRGANKIIPHMIAYMEQHHDSILIWYHPKAEVKYARDTDVTVSMKEDVIYLTIHGLLVVVAALSIRWQIRYNKKKKAAATQ
jgi:hypothetical protein